MIPFNQSIFQSIARTSRGSHGILSSRRGRECSTRGAQQYLFASLVILLFLLNFLCLYSIFNHESSQHSYPFTFYRRHKWQRELAKRRMNLREFDGRCVILLTNQFYHSQLLQLSYHSYPMSLFFHQVEIPPVAAALSAEPVVPQEEASGSTITSSLVSSTWNLFWKSK